MLILAVPRSLWASDRPGGAISQPVRSLVALLTEHTTLALAEHPKRDAEIVFAEELEPAGETDPVRRVGRDIPAVDPGAADPAIAALHQVPVDAQVQHQVL